jgi:hypothetical protein
MNDLAIRTALFGSHSLIAFCRPDFNTRLSIAASLAGLVGFVGIVADSFSLVL